ncbi:MAG: hypothetical protein GTO29_13395 [Candidatus Latescibacteria bacterium]|nr:hypothetical protein [Candidatus Latescibacterota bacterium]NIO57246.1 hypothetical protein [Candidatus Latescibacterota bacterium]
MKRTLLLVVFSMAVAGAAGAQLGSIGLFADTQGLDCNLYDTGSTVAVHVLHVHSTGATGSQFKVIQADGACMTWIGYTLPPFPTVIGDPQTGITIAYGTCLVSPIHLTTITYCGCNSPSCSMIRVVPDPAAIPQGVLVADCADPPNLIVATGGAAFINPDATCDCDTPVRQTRWGQVKALYQ